MRRSRGIKRNTKMIILFSLLMMILLLITYIYFSAGMDGLLSGTRYFEVMTVFIAFLGVVGFLYEKREEQDLEEAEFITNINTTYIEHKEYQELLDRIENNKISDFSEVEDDVVQFLDFFEPIYILMKKKIISIEMINDLFCYRFFTVVNSALVQENLVGKHPQFYSNIINLHYLWKTYREDKGQEIPFFDTDLSRFSWYKDFTESSRHLPKRQKNAVVSTTIDLKNVTVRPAAATDAESIRALYATLMEKDYCTKNLPDTINSINGSELNRIYVATLGEEVIGTIQCSAVASLVQDRPYMIMEYFIVDERYRGNGVGKLLLNEVEKAAKSINANEIFFVSGKSRKSAHKFYRNCGYDASVKGFRKEFF